MMDRAAFVKASWVNVLSSVLKIAVEGTLGVFSGSLALTADAVHSIADLLASGVVLIWGRVVYDGPDDVHPHGHDRFEPLAALFVGAVLLVLGAKLLADSATAFLAGPEATYSPFLVAGLCFSIVDRYACYAYTRLVNHEVDSPSLRALAADSKNDVFTTGAAFLGVAGMAFGVPLLDPLAGGIVSLLVVYEGVSIGRENVRYLADSAAPRADRERIEEAIRSHPAVHGVHDFVAYYSGHVIEVEFHAEVDADQSLADAHQIETDLRRRVRGIEPVSDVHVHLDPSGIGEWKEAGDDSGEETAESADASA